ncbi:hypothetical protein KAM621c_34520 [Citrobacter braakii]|uniref:Uncharacterized protein n=1 Tax=Citrobacter braakii TaxID=57706 RepID=A0AAD1P4F5_CITBR|nr:hypothetical protein KAM621c_34520 [Citrobacter braakii]
MSKAIFLGESIYPWLGMREILRGSSLYIDIAGNGANLLI